MFAARTSLFSPRALAGLLAGSLLGLCASGCSSSPQPNDPATKPGVALLNPALQPSGGRVDSINGFAGHHFGEPRSAFAGIVKMGIDANGQDSYVYPDMKRVGGWWAKQDKIQQGSLTVFYYFPNGKFSSVLVFVRGKTTAKLRPEAQYLLGPGLEKEGNLSWIGARAEAYYAEPRPGINEGPSLLIRAHDYPEQVALAKKAQDNALAARVRAENAR